MVPSNGNFLSSIRDWWEQIVVFFASMGSISVWIVGIKRQTHDNKRDIARLWAVRNEDREEFTRSVEGLRQEVHTMNQNLFDIIKETRKS